MFLVVLKDKSSHYFYNCILNHFFISFLSANNFFSHKCLCKQFIFESLSLQAIFLPKLAPPLKNNGMSLTKNVGPYKNFLYTSLYFGRRGPKRKVKFWPET